MRTELISHWTKRYQIVGEIILELLLNRDSLELLEFYWDDICENKNMSRLEAVFGKGNAHVRQSVNKYLQLLSQPPYEEILFLKDYGRPKEYRLREGSLLHRQLKINQDQLTKKE